MELITRMLIYSLIQARKVVIRIMEKAKVYKSLFILVKLLEYGNSCMDISEEFDLQDATWTDITSMTIQPVL